MATCEVGTTHWMVIVVFQDDPNLSKTYRMSPDITLSELMQVWKDDVKLFGHWVFKSPNEGTTYHEDWLTLEMMGETVPDSQMISLKVELSDEPTPVLIKEIFVYFKDRCHRLFVLPHEKLCEVMWRLPGRPRCLEYQGRLLNPKLTIKQAGLKNKCVIHESLVPIAVKLSSGYTRVFKVPSDSLVLHLQEKVNRYEAEEYSLRYQGRLLNSDENVQQLKKVVEVATAEFTVNINGRRISWKSKDEPVAVAEFVSKLVAKSDIEAEKVKRMEFVCVGCQRHIFNAGNDSQLLSIECCPKRSIDLIAREPSGAGTDIATNDAAERIQILQEHLEQWRRKTAREEGSRSVCRELKETFATDVIGCTVLTRCSEILLRRMNELEDKIKELEEIKKLKTRNTEAQKETERLQTSNTKNMEEIEKLKQDNRQLTNELEERLGAELLVMYFPGEFSPASRPEVQPRGEVPWITSSSYFTCRVPGIRPGWRPFQELRDALQPLVTGPEIAGIAQYHGSSAGRAVAWVASPGDEVALSRESPFCDVDGAQVSWKEAGKPQGEWIQAGGRVFICGGGRRTVLRILS